MPIKLMQTEKYTLVNYRACLDLLIHQVSSGHNVPRNDMYQCRVGQICIGCNSDKILSKDFAHGVIKMQNSDIQSITSTKHNACAVLYL